MAETNVIELLTRYAVLAGRNPRENRLTAGLVATLAQNASLARSVVAAWHVALPPTAPVRVRAQVPVGVRRRIDVQLTAGSAAVRPSESGSRPRSTVR